MWKAILVLFIVSGISPPGMIIGEFPEAFTSEADCERYLAATEDDIAAKVEKVKTDPAVKKSGDQIIGHRASCVKDESGQRV